MSRTSFLLLSLAPKPLLTSESAKNKKCFDQWVWLCHTRQSEAKSLGTRRSWDGKKEMPLVVQESGLCPVGLRSPLEREEKGLENQSALTGSPLALPEEQREPAARLTWPTGHPRHILPQVGNRALPPGFQSEVCVVQEILWQRCWCCWHI